MGKPSQPAVSAADLIARKQRAAEARKNPALHHAGAPEGYRLRGVSTLRDAEGNVIQEWVKTAKEPDTEAVILDAFERMVAERNLPVARRVPQPRPVALNSDLLTVYPFGDPHLGMLSWHMETGEDFDLNIATSTLTAAARHLVDLAPASEQCLLINLGDYFHSDNLQSTTARSGHHLDTDSRWPKILGVGVDCFIECIECALRKHKIVHVIIEIGNHDDHAAMMLAVLLDRYYRNNPRVKIDKSPATFHWFEFGLNFFGVTHGHNTKLLDLPGIMANDKPVEWGRTKFRYWHTGHVHHTSQKEHAGCLMETHRTLAARDAWHTSKGYRAGRSMQCIAYHKEYGEVLRHTVGIEQLRRP